MGNPSVDLYIELLDELSEHYQNVIFSKGKTLFSPSSPELKELYRDSLKAYREYDNGDVVVEELKESVKIKSIAQVQDTEAALNVYTNNYKDSKQSKVDLNHYIDELNKQENIDVDRAVSAIRSTYSRAKELVKEHPDKAALIVGAVKAFSELFNAAIKEISNFISDIITNIIKWIKDIFYKISATFTVITSNIRNWFIF